jgi:hypothetical protein
LPRWKSLDRAKGRQIDKEKWREKTPDSQDVPDVCWNDLAGGRMNFWIGTDRLSIVGGVAGLVLIVGVVAYYCVSLEMRVDTLEAQLKILAAAPNPEKMQRVSPLLETCQQLYKESVEGVKRTGDFGATARTHLHSLSCDELLKTAGK